MSYMLNIADDGRIMSSTYPKYATSDSILVEELPEGNIYDYRYENGSYVYDPLPKAEIVETPSQFDRVEAQATYTAMMTDTLLEV